MKRGSATKRLLRITGIGAGVIILLVVLAKLMGWMDGSEIVHTVETSNAELRTITQKVSASGKMQPETEVIIRPDVSGEIIELNVREGDFVRENDLLLRIKPDLYETRIDELNAMLLTQQSRLEQARSGMLQAEVEFKSQEQLFEADAVSELEYLRAKNNFEAEQANFKAAQYQIESARAQLRTAEEELQQTVIRSPNDGTISRLSVERGERVLGQAQTAGTEMMRIAHMEQMEVVVEVNENDIVNVSLGDTSEIEIDAYPDRFFEGVITEIANSADITESGTAEQVTNYEVKIRVSTPHNLDMAPQELMEESSDEIPEDEFVPNFKPGMSATVDIRTETVYDVVSVPIQAVTVREVVNESEPDTTDSLETDDQNPQPSEDGTASRDDNYKRVVFVVDDGVAKQRVVQTGISDNQFIQIQNGLQEGEEVVTGSYRVLSRELNDGDQVEVTDQSPFVAQQN